MQFVLYYFCANPLDASSTRSLIYQLQTIAHASGHAQPLLIAIDQENGMLNNLNDKDYITQFPGSMGVVATQSTDLAQLIARAVGMELGMLGINWILGPVVDVLSNSANRLLGVRSMGDDPLEVTEFAIKILDGFRQAGIATCGKHFPGYGNATVDSTLALPIVPDSIAQLETAALKPFRTIIQHGIDSIMVGGCALPKVTMSEMHACLSKDVVQGLLRDAMGHTGVVVSECLEMKTLYENVGVRQGAVMAASAGCDVIIVCSSHKLQLEAVSGIFGAVRENILPESAVFAASERVAALKRRYLNWDVALNPPPMPDLATLKESHAPLATIAYEQSVTILRDHSHYIPLTQSIEPDADILLLTPLVVPLTPGVHTEDMFKSFGLSLARLHTGKVAHSSYSAAGFCEYLLDSAGAVIVVTTDVARNMYQTSFTKHIGLLCSQQHKPMLAVAAASPYDFALDRTVGTYICSYEITPQSMDVVARILFGRLVACGRFPGSRMYQSKNMVDPVGQRRPRWLVEPCNFTRDMPQLKALWEECFPSRRFGMQFDVFASTFCNSDIGKGQTHFTVRNSSTNILYGFCATWVHQAEGSIMLLLVLPSRRRMAIGQSLHDHAIKYLKQTRGCTSLSLGTRVPSFFEGIPLKLRGNNMLLPQPPPGGGTSTTANSTATANALHEVDLVKWFRHSGWNIPASGARAKAVYIHTLRLSNLSSWSLSGISPKREFTSLQIPIPVGSNNNNNNNASNNGATSAAVIFQQCHQTLAPLVMALIPENDPMRQVYTAAFRDETVVVAIRRDATTNTDTVVGSIVAFTRGNGVEVYMPWILEFDDARVGGLCGVIVAGANDKNYYVDGNNNTINNRLLPVYLGLVGFAVELFQRQGLERCVIAGVVEEKGTSQNVKRLQLMGFERWRSFLAVKGHDDVS